MMSATTPASPKALIAFPSPARATLYRAIPAGKSALVTRNGTGISIQEIVLGQMSEITPVGVVETFSTIGYEEAISLLSRMFAGTVVEIEEALTFYVLQFDLPHTGDDE